MLEFSVNAQTLTRTDKFKPAACSVGYLKAVFTFNTDEWKEGRKVLRATNKHDSFVYEADIIDGAATVPWEALKEFGKFSVSVYQEKDGVEITTNTVDIQLEKTLQSGSSTHPPTPTELDKLREEIEELREEVKNISAGGADLTGAVLYTPQTLTKEQKAQARENVGAASVDDSGGNVNFQTDETLILENGILSVNTDAINTVSDVEIAQLNSIMQ